MQRLFAAVLLIGLLAAAAVVRPAWAFGYVEAPSLEPAVTAGALPPLVERLPENPLVIDVKAMGREPGRHGGEWRMLIFSAKDVKLLTVYGYARLVGYNEKYELEPDILESYTVEDGRIFTFKLRKGHKWSDGQPFTTEDFRYYWEDVANNEELSPSGPPREFVIEGEKAAVEIIDPWTIRYSWSHPNPFFLPALAGPAPLYIYRPAHYLKHFHKRYGTPTEPGKKGSKMRNWAAKHNNVDNMYKADNPELPTLEPWVNTTKPPATRYVAKRNPYFHRVDENGNQLPYIDQVTLTIADSKLIPAKVGSGETDLQARALNFSDYTFLKEGEKRNDYTVRLWRNSNGSHLSLYPNLTISDEAWRKTFRDVRFRRALSLGINRHQINQVLYYGLGLEAGNSVLPQSALYDEAYRCWCQYDPKQANALLDDMGLTQRDSGDIRLLPDGRPLEIIVETAGEETEQTDVLELVRDDWAALGIKLYTKPSQREVFRNRIFAGETQISIWAGLDNGLPTPEMSPAELAPTMQTSLEWPQWGQHYETMGRAGEPPDIPEAIELLDLHERWLKSGTTEERYQIWHRMLDIYTDNVFAIGLIAGVLQPVVVSNRLHNVPVDAIYSWDPGSHFGMHRPDTFWFDPSDQLAGN